jgi:hypothetical protein
MNDIAHEARAEFASDVAQRKAEILKQVLRAEYVAGAFSGQDEDWLQWLTQDEKARTLRLLSQAVDRNEMDEALRRAMAILFSAVDGCAKGHVEQCVKNGAL